MIYKKKISFRVRQVVSRLLLRVLLLESSGVIIAHFELVISER